MLHAGFEDFVFERGSAGREVVGLLGKGSAIDTVGEEIIEIQSGFQFVLVRVVEEGDGRSLGNDAELRGFVPLRNSVEAHGEAFNGIVGSVRGRSDHNGRGLVTNIGGRISTSTTVVADWELILRGNQAFVGPFLQLDGRGFGFVGGEERGFAGPFSIQIDVLDVLGFEH